jgi:hypothetical protein
MACTDCVYATDINPVSNAIVNNTVTGNLLFESININ